MRCHAAERGAVTGRFGPHKPGADRRTVGRPSAKSSACQHEAMTASEALLDLAGRYWEAVLEAFPTMATLHGDHRFDDRLEDVSAEAEARQRASWLELRKAVEASPDDVLLRLVLAESLVAAGDIESALDQYVVLLDQQGLPDDQLVPVGELEAWLADRAIGASKRTKWSWANEAAASVRHLGPQAGDVWDFMRSVGAYLALGTRQ